MKPLEWENDPKWRWNGRPAGKGFGNYCAWVIEHNGSYLFAADQTKHPTLEAAKAAAQADYERRIRGALEPTPADPLGDERVRGLVEALNHIDALDPEDMVYGCSPDAARGLIIQMGQTARAALAALKGEE